MSFSQKSKITGNLDYPNRFKNKKQKSCMEDRIGFKTSALRKEFFWAVREAAGTRSWNELKDMLGLPRTSFQRYQYGEWLLPAQVFDSMLKLLSKERQEFFLKQTFKRPRNWGSVKGGKKNFEKNSTDVIKRLRAGFQKKIAEPIDSLASVDLAQPLSKELCEFVGAVIGDGCIDGHVNKYGTSKYHISITGDSDLDKDYLTDWIPSIVKNLFDIPSYIRFRKTCRAMVLNFHSKSLFAFFTRRLGFIPGNKTYTVKIPEEILQAGEEFIFPTIRGIFDTDGSVFFDKRKVYKKPYGRITLKVASKPLHDQLKNFLQDHFSFYSAVKKTDHAPIYEITIYGNKQIEKWMRLIGFSNERHLCKIRKHFKP